MRNWPLAVLGLTACIGSFPKSSAQTGSEATTGSSMSMPAASDAAAPASDGATAPADLSIPPGKIAIFVAQGSAGRTTLSCDDGRTWVGNRSWDVDADPLLCGTAQQAVCYSTNCSYEIGGQCEQRQCCNDTPDVAKGVTFGDGAFVATWGWGSPGAIKRSTNGVDWTTTQTDADYGGVAYGAGRFVAAARAPYWSPNGIDWSAGQTADFRDSSGGQIWSVRHFKFVDYDGGRFIAIAQGNYNAEMLISKDGGQTWAPPSVPPSDCITSAGSLMTYGGLLYGNGVAVIVEQGGHACRSTDGGETWTTTASDLGQVLSHGVWTGSEFWFWADDRNLIHSADGASWVKTAMTTPLRLGPVARSPEGTLVAINNVWAGYGQQQFYRSTDGLSWDALPASAFQNGHPIFFLTFGYADRSSVCQGN